MSIWVVIFVAYSDFSKVKGCYTQLLSNEEQMKVEQGHYGKAKI